MDFRELPLTAFTDLLSSAAPTPGGGSVSALSGALAASLVAMVARATAASRAFADRAAEMDNVAVEADLQRVALLELIDEDASAFDRVMAAFRMPKETAEEQAARAAEVQRSYQAAVEPPLLVCRRSLLVLGLARDVAERGKPSVVSDAGVGALLAASALEGAALNVQINLASIEDEAFRTSREEEIEEVRARGEALRSEALNTVSAKIG